MSSGLASLLTAVPATRIKGRAGQGLDRRTGFLPVRDGGYDERLAGRRGVVERPDIDGFPGIWLALFLDFPKPPRLASSSLSSLRLRLVLRILICLCSVSSDGPAVPLREWGLITPCGGVWMRRVIVRCSNLPRVTLTAVRRITCGPNSWRYRFVWLLPKEKRGEKDAFCSASESLAGL